MINALKQFSGEDRKKISQRIAELERHSDAEVVCAVTTESGRYDRAESICGLLTGLLFLISGNKIASMGEWEDATALTLAVQVLLVVGGFLMGSVAASYCHGLRRLFIRKKDTAIETNKCAHTVFSRHGIGNTRHHGGLLIYLSLFEHRLEVIGDRALAEKLSTADLEAIRDRVLAEVRQGKLMEGMLAGLDEAEAILVKALPASDEDSSPLENELLLFHPRP